MKLFWVCYLYDKNKRFELNSIYSQTLTRRSVRFSLRSSKGSSSMSDTNVEIYLRCLNEVAERHDMTLFDVAQIVSIDHPEVLEIIQSELSSSLDDSLLSHIETLPPELIFKILLEYDLTKTDIMAFCTTNRAFSGFCKDTYFLDLLQRRVDPDIQIYIRLVGQGDFRYIDEYEVRIAFGRSKTMKSVRSYGILPIPGCQSGRKFAKKWRKKGIRSSLGIDFILDRESGTIKLEYSGYKGLALPPNPDSDSVPDVYPKSTYPLYEPTTGKAFTILGPLPQTQYRYESRNHNILMRMDIHFGKEYNIRKDILKPYKALVKSIYESGIAPTKMKKNEQGDFGIGYQKIKGGKILYYPFQP